MSVFGSVWLYSAVAFILGILLTWIFWVRPLQKLVRTMRRERTATGAASTPVESTLRERVGEGAGVTAIGGTSLFDSTDMDDAGGGDPFDDVPFDDHATLLQPTPRPVKASYDRADLGADPWSESMSVDGVGDERAPHELDEHDTAYFAYLAQTDEETLDDGFDESDDEDTADPEDPVAARGALRLPSDSTDYPGYPDDAYYSDYTADADDHEAISGGSLFEEAVPPGGVDDGDVADEQPATAFADIGAAFGHRTPERVDQEQDGFEQNGFDADAVAPEAVNSEPARALFEPVVASELPEVEGLPDPRRVTRHADVRPEPTQDDQRESDTADDWEGPIGPFGLGSALPEPDGSAPADGFEVKARTSSMVFHTSSSPFYNRLLPQVWFRTPDDAKRAGFTSWERPVK